MSDKRQETKHTARLRGFAEPMLREAQNDLAKTGRVTPMTLFVSGDGYPALVAMPDHVAELLESGEGKDHLFDTLRKVIRSMHCSAFGFLSDAWFARSTELGEKLGLEEWQKLMRECDTEELAKRGYVVRSECIMVNVQTPERVLLLTQPYVRGEGRSITYGKREEAEMAIDEFEGRQKMFGDTGEEKLHLHRNSAKGNKRKKDGSTQ